MRLEKMQGADKHRKPGKPFVLLSSGRSGTNFLISKLLMTRQALVGWEPFNTPLFGYENQAYFSIAPQVIDRMNDVGFRDNDPDGYLLYCGGLTGAIDGSGVRVSGFKIFPDHNEDMYWQMTRDTRFKALVLQRGSVLSAYSSWQIALQTNEWTKVDRVKPAGAPDQITIEFDPSGFETYANIYRARFQKTVENLEAAGVEYLKFYYEDLVSNSECFESVLSFLGIESDAIGESWVEKQNDPNVLKRFSNPELVLPYLEREEQDELLRINHREF